MWHIGCVTSKDFVVLSGVLTSPPLSTEARVTAGSLLRRLQNGETLSMPQSRPVPSIGKRVDELRVRDGDVTWRVIYRTDPDAIVFAKETRTTPRHVIRACQDRLAQYDRDVA